MSLVPRLRFKEFSDDWNTFRFDEIYSFVPTNSLSRGMLNSFSGSIKNIHYGDIHTKFKTHFYIRKEQVPYINEDVPYKIRELEYCFERDLVIADASEDYKDIGKTIEIMNLNNEKLVAGLHTYIARDVNNKMSLGFGAFLMKTFLVRHQIMTLTTGTSVLSISKTNLSKVRINIPSLAEQKEIASFLGVIDDKIDLLQKKENLLKKYKQCVLQKIFNQEIRFKQDDGSEFPAWNKNMTFGDCLSIPLREKPNQIDKNKLLTVKLNLNGIHQNKNVDTLSLGATYFVRRKGQFIYGKQNLFNGAFAIIPDEFDTYLSSTDIPALDFKENCIPKFLLLYLGRMSFYKSLEKYAVGTGSKRVHEALFLTIPICIPSILEQQEIANFLTAIDEKIDITTKQLEKTRQYKTALLQQLFI